MNQDCHILAGDLTILQWWEPDQMLKSLSSKSIVQQRNVNTLRHVLKPNRPLVTVQGCTATGGDLSRESPFENLCEISNRLKPIQISCSIETRSGQ